MLHRSATSHTGCLRLAATTDYTIYTIYTIKSPSLNRLTEVHTPSAKANGVWFEIYMHLRDKFNGSLDQWHSEVLFPWRRSYHRRHKNPVTAAHNLLCVCAYLRVSCSRSRCFLAKNPIGSGCAEVRTS